jgi:hypothetical protein
MTRHTSLRSQLYRTARDLGNVQAASKGPTSYGRRVVRRKVYRTTNGMTRHLLRGFGLCCRNLGSRHRVPPPDPRSRHFSRDAALTE